MPPDLPDLTTPEGRSVASDMLAEQGWALEGCLPAEPQEALEVLWRVCPDTVRCELGCRFAERALVAWDARYPGDSRLREAIDAARGRSRGELGDEVAIAMGTQLDEAIASAAGRVARGGQAESRGVCGARAGAVRRGAEGAAGRMSVTDEPVSQCYAIRQSRYAWSAVSSLQARGLRFGVRLPKPVL